MMRESSLNTGTINATREPNCRGWKKSERKLARLLRHARSHALFGARIIAAAAFAVASVGPADGRAENQPLGESLHIAMAPVVTDEGDVVDLSVAIGGAGLLLIGGDARPDLIVPPTIRFVFVRPR
jgi:hypothetical protein